MRILQCPVPNPRLDSKVGNTVVDTLSYFVLMALGFPPLIDDGAGEGMFRGTPTVNPPKVTRITGEQGLLLCAKDMSTLSRGLKAYPENVTLTSDDGGLGLIAATFDKGTGGSKGGKFVRWGLNNAKQHFLHSTFNLAAWLAKHNLDYVDNKKAKKKLNKLFLALGGDYLFTFEDFRKSVDHDSMMELRGAMVFVCRTVDMAPCLDVPNARVMPYIENRIKVSSLGTLATRALKQRDHISGGIFG